MLRGGPRIQIERSRVGLHRTRAKVHQIESELRRGESHTHPEYAPSLPAAHTLATRPAATLAVRGLRIILSDPAYMGGADVEQVCLRTSGGLYEWADSSVASS